MTQHEIWLHEEHDDLTCSACAWRVTLPDPTMAEIERAKLTHEPPAEPGVSMCAEVNGRPDVVHFVISTEPSWPTLTKRETA